MERGMVGNWAGFLTGLQDGEGEGGREGLWKWILALFLLAFLLRLPLLFFPEVIHNDGTAYIRAAARIFSGHWAEGKAPPLYPALTALADFFVGNYELSGILVSVLSGALVVVPVFLLGKEIFGGTVAILSALIATVHPTLYIASGSVLTESTYHLFLAASVLLGWYAFRRGRLAYSFLFGLFTCLAYLTRPEAIGFLAIFCAWVFLVSPSGERRPWIRKGLIAAVALFSFLVFSSPYLIELRKDTGKWLISKKASVFIGSLTEEEEAPSIVTIKKKKGITLSSLVKNPLPVMRRIGAGLLESVYKFQQVYTPILFFLAVAGWIVVLKKKNPSLLLGSGYLMVYHLFFFGLVFPFFWVTRRYTSQMVSISIPWAAYGFLETMNWARRRYSDRRVPWKKLTPSLFAAILLVLFVQGRVIHSREHRFIQKDIGLWMKGHLAKEGNIMSKLPQEAFYAERSWVRMPEGDYEEILKTARSKGVRYIAVDESVETDSPGFWERMRKEDLVSLIDLKKQNRRIVVFEIVHPKGDE